MSRIHRLPFPSRKNGSHTGSKNIEPIIEWIQSLVHFFESGKAIELHKLKYSLSPFSDRAYWGTLRRLLARYEYFPLFERIQGYRKQIDNIVGVFSTPANDESFIDPFISLKKKNENILDDTDLNDIDWQGDILILFGIHFPRVVGFLSIDDIICFREVLFGTTQNRHEYEARLELYRTDYSLFVQDFCPGMDKINDL